MGGGAGPAGQVLAGPLFCRVNEPLLFLNKRRVLGITLLVRNHCHLSFCLVKHSLKATACQCFIVLARTRAADCDDVIVMNIIKIKISRHASVPLILPDHPKIASAGLVHYLSCGQSIMSNESLT